MDNFDLYRKLLTVKGNTQRERNIQNLKDDFLSKAVDNPAYTKDTAYRNGEMQRFLIEQSTTNDKANLTTFPNEEIMIGDMIYFNDKHWLVYEVSQAHDWQKTAVLWLCNLKLRFQVGTSEIHERWCVLDSGVYSTTITGDKTVQIGDKQYNLWITKDEITKYIHTDKRLSIGKKYNKDKEEILDIFAVTAVDSVSKNYGENAHLIKISLRDASNFNPDTDNVEEGICDEVKANLSDQPSSAYCEIAGKNKVRLGETIALSAKFYVGKKEVEEEAEWEIAPKENSTVNGNTLMISCPKDDNYIGVKYSVKLTAKGANNYTEANHIVEVI